MSQFDDRVSALVPHITPFVTAQIDNDKCSTDEGCLEVVRSIYDQRVKLGVARKLRTCGTGRGRQERALVEAVKKIVELHRAAVAA